MKACETTNGSITHNYEPILFFWMQWFSENEIIALKKNEKFYTPKGPVVS